MRVQLGNPHLAHPTNHFNITPFEAVYCDPITYEHIKIMKTFDDNDGLDEAFAVHTRNFILDEVEADIVGLQNKIIGDNHVQWDANYKYRAWYKAYAEIHIGNKVTPKTDPGDYIIKSSGDITVYAGQSISIKPGFHTQNGSEFHAFIHVDGCSRPREGGNLAEKGDELKSGKNQSENISEITSIENTAESELQTGLRVSPNPTTGKCTVALPQCAGSSYVITDMNGRLLTEGTLPEDSNILHLQLPKGICYFRWICAERSETLKIVTL